MENGTELLTALFADFGLFTLKTFVVVIAIGVILTLMAIFAAQLGSRGKHTKGLLEVEKINTKFKNLRNQMQSQLMGKKEFKSLSKTEKKVAKASSKTKSDSQKPRVFVLDFDGDLRASQASSLREEVTAILSVSKSGDEVVARVESGGGLVSSYGLAASQLERLKSHGLKLVICVDKIAASGGYMMACVADHICAAPFAIVGSIGVVAQVPNVNKLLKRHDIDYREVTAGEYKRTVSIFGEITEPGLAKFKTQIEETHVLFKDFVLRHRPKIDIAKVATGEYWYGTQAVSLGLIDEVTTSDEYIFRKIDSSDVFRVSYHPRRRLSEKISESLGQVFYRLGMKAFRDMNNSSYGL